MDSGERAWSSVSENSRTLRSRLCRAAASQYRVSPEVKLVSDLCQSRATLRRPSLSFFFSLPSPSLSSCFTWPTPLSVLFISLPVASAPSSPFRFRARASPKSMYPGLPVFPRIPARYTYTVIHSATVWSCYQWGKSRN